MNDPYIRDVKCKYLLPLIRLLDGRRTRNTFLSAVPEEYFDADAMLELDRQTNNPGRWLLFHLDNQGARLSQFISWLLMANLENAVLALGVDVPLEIIQQPPSRVTIQEGERLIISCEASSFPRPEYQWFKEETELLLQQDPELDIPCIRLQDSGLYFCIISKRGTRGRRDTHIRTSPVKVIVCPDTSFDLVNEHDFIEGNHASSEKDSSEFQPNYAYQDLQRPSTSAAIQQENTNARTQYFAEDKIALFIANDSYEAYEPLGTPATDVSDLAELFKKMNFKVLAFRNLNITHMDKVLSVFYNLISENSYAVFFFAGHGFESDGQTYLQPVDCSGLCIKDESVCTEKNCTKLAEKKSQH